MDTGIEVAEEICLQVEFISALKKYPILLNKSQLPNIKKEKDDAVVKVIDEYYRKTLIKLTAEQLKKKLNNIKTDTKKKADINHTGNKKIILKTWELEFLKLLEYNSKPTFKQTEGALSVGLSILAPKNTTDDIPSRPKKIKPIKVVGVLSIETDETVNLTDEKLARLVLLKQLEVVKLQKETYPLQLNQLKAPIESPLTFYNHEIDESNITYENQERN